MDRSLHDRGSDLTTDEPNETLQASGEPRGKDTVLSAAIIWSFSQEAEPDDAAMNAEDDIAYDLQCLGSRVQIYELHAATRGIDYALVREVVGLMSSAGEQIGLSGTALRDAQSWLLAVRRGDDARAPIAARALSEIANYYTLGAAHALINALLLLAVLDTSCAPELSKFFTKAMPFVNGSKERRHWVSCNTKNAEKLRQATGGSRLSALQAAGTALETMVRGQAWNTVTTERHNGYHRWRWQTVGSGVDPDLRNASTQKGPLVMYSQSGQRVPDVTAAAEVAVMVRRSVARFATDVAAALDQMVTARLLP